MLAGPNRSYSPVQKAHYIPSFPGRIFFCCSNNADVHLICVLSVCMRVKSHVESLLSLHPNDQINSCYKYSTEAIVQFPSYF